jgi:c(7)-type cytochrome triheme protein
MARAFILDWHGPRARRQRWTAGVFSIALLAYGCSLFSNPPQSNLPVNPPAADVVTEASPVPSPAADLDYSRFKHDSSSHTRLPCLVCHVREEGATKVGFPGQSGHVPCASCHVQQFANPNNAMCSICHTEPASGAVKALLQIKSFGAKFDHGRHTRQTGCVTCHSTSRGGVAFSIPAGSNAHKTCFTCHEPEREIAGKNIGSCNACHEPGRRNRPSEWAKSFQFKFSHAEHMMRGKTNCASCHNVLAGSAQGRQVTSPVVAMHFAPAGGRSCGACHNDKKAFGTGDFTNCRRCHEGSNFSF